MKMRMWVLVPAAALALLAGCTTPHQAHHGGGMMGGPGMGGPGMGPSSGGTGMGMGGPGAGGQGMPMMANDPARTCQAYRQSMAGRTPAEQQAAMEAQMRAMHGGGGSYSPEQVRSYREMMDRNCGGPAAR